MVAAGHGRWPRAYRQGRRLGMSNREREGSGQSCGGLGMSSRNFYNISVAYNNNSFILNYPQLGVYSVASITLPDGLYTIDALNSYIQQISIAYGFY